MERQDFFCFGETTDEKKEKQKKKEKKIASRRLQKRMKRNEDGYSLNDMKKSDKDERFRPC